MTKTPQGREEVRSSRERPFSLSLQYNRICITEPKYIHIAVSNVNHDDRAIFAAATGDTAGLCRLIAEGFDVNTSVGGTTVLHIAIEHVSYEIVHKKFCYKNPCDRNPRSCDVSTITTIRII